MDTLKRWSLLAAVMLLPVLAHAQVGTRIDQLELRPKTQAALAQPPLSAAKDGNAVFCSDCVAGSDPCVGGGTGAQALRLGSAWTCTAASHIGTPWKSLPYIVAGLPACDATTRYNHVTVIDGFGGGDCSEGGGAMLSDCICTPDGIWAFVGSTVANATLQSAYDNNPVIVSGPNGLKLSGFNSHAKSLQVCDFGDAHCGGWYYDQSGRFQFWLSDPADLFTKLYPGYGGGFLNASGQNLFKVSEAGGVSGTAQFLEKCQVNFNTDSTDDNLPLTSFQQPVTIKKVWCHYGGATPTTAATFQFEHGNGTALTVTTPTCAAPGAIAVPQTVTANGSFAAYEMLRYDVTNTPNLATDVYDVCVSYVLD